MEISLNAFEWKSEEQAEACITIAHSLVNLKRDVAVILPTGMGKTLVIGVAAKILVSLGKCLVVITPTNAVLDQMLRVLKGFKIPIHDLSNSYTTLDGILFLGSPCSHGSYCLCWPVHDHYHKHLYRVPWKYRRKIGSNLL